MKLLNVKIINGNYVQINPKNIIALKTVKRVKRGNEIEIKYVTEIETNDGYIYANTQIYVIENAILNALYL